MKATRFFTRLAGWLLLPAALLGPELAPAQSLEEALDSPPGWTWTTTATDSFGNPHPPGVWAGQTAISHDGVDAARSGPLPLWGHARLRTESIAGTGTVTFWRRHGRTPEQNHMWILANGAWMGLFLPGGTWQPVAIDFPPGPGSLEFGWANYDWAGSEPDNHAYVDEVSFVPTAGAPQFLADPIPNLTVGEGYTIQPPIAVKGQKPMRLDLQVPGFGPNSIEIPNAASNGAPVLSAWPWGFEATPARAGVWTITASNALGAVTRSFNVTVAPTAPHSLSIEGPSTVWAGATLRLKVNVRGTAPFIYQWRKNGVALSGQTAQTLEIAGFSAGAVGTYSVVVENALGAGESEAFDVGLGNDAPVLVSQSGDVDAPSWGWTAELTVDVTGTPPFETEWRRDGTVVQSESYALSGSGHYYLWGTEFAGVYEFTSRNGLGSVTSAPIVVQEAPLGAAIADAVDNRTVGWRVPDFSAWEVTTTETHDGVDAAAYLNPWPETLRTAVKGPAAVSFWWRVNQGSLDFKINGSTEATISYPFADSGWQRVDLSVGAGWHELEWVTQDWTTAAYLDQFSVVEGGGGPVIVQQPEGGNYFGGVTATISVQVTGTGPFDLRLFKDDGTTPVQEALGLTSTTHSFNLTVSPGVEGAYWIEVTDNASRKAVSDDAVIMRNSVNFPQPVNVLEAAGQPALNGWYTYYSATDGHPRPARPWYRTRQDGVAPGADRSARTPALNSGELAAIVVAYDAGADTARLRFWARVVGAPFADVFFVTVNGVIQSPTFAGTAIGASGQTWTAYYILLPSGASYVQFEVLADRNGVTAWLDQLEFVPAIPPQITEQPVPLVRPAGEPGALSVVATGVGPFSYQWFKNGGALIGETNDVLAFPSLTVGDAGLYHVEVSNPFGTVASDTVSVTVTGPRPQITQPLQPQQLAPGDNLRLEVVANSSNGPLSYRWFRNGVLVQTGGTTFQRNPATPADHGLYRVDVSDPYYTVSSEAAVSVSHVYYQLTVLPRLPGGTFATAGAINNAGVVAGYGNDSSGSVTAIVWSNGVPIRLTPPGTQFNWAASINNHGVVVGRFGGGGPLQGVLRWGPPYTPGVFDNLGEPFGPDPLSDFPRVNDAGVVTATLSGTDSFGGPRHAFRYTTAGVWEPLGPLSGAAPLFGASDRGWARPLDLNNAGVIVGLSYFDQTGAAAPTHATGWIFDPAAPGGRTAMDTLSPDLALTPSQPWGWADSVNDLGDIAARRWGAGGPTKLFLIHFGGAVTKLVEVPALPGHPGLDRFNVDAMNNRRELVGSRDWPGPYDQRAMLVRSRGTPPGGTPATLTDFEIYDLNDLVLGGTGGILLQLARDINDAGQIVGSGRWTDGRPNPDVAFLLTPITSYTGMAARAVEDVIVRRAGQGIRFSAASLLRNDLGQAPLTLHSIAAAGAAGGVITHLGGGWYQYGPPAGPDAPDSFTYVVRANDGSTATGTVRVLIEAEPPPPQNQLPIQLLPGGEVRVRFVGIPWRTYRIQAAPAVNGPWTTLATRVAGPTGLVEYQETPPPGGSRFYRMIE